MKVNLIQHNILNPYANAYNDSLPKNRLPYTITAGQDTFTRNIHFAGETKTNPVNLKKIFHESIPCMYCGHEMITRDLFTRLTDKDIAAKPIACKKNNSKKIYYSFLDYLEPHKNKLKPIEKEVYEILKENSIKNPDKNMQQILAGLAPQYKPILRDEQLHVFEELDSLAEKLPAETKAKYDELRLETNNKLEEIPILTPFSAKTFVYKLNNIIDLEIDNGKMQYRLSTLNNGFKLFDDSVSSKEKFEIISAMENILRKQRNSDYTIFSSLQKIRQTIKNSEQKQPMVIDYDLHKNAKLEIANNILELLSTNKDSTALSIKQYCEKIIEDINYPEKQKKTVWDENLVKNVYISLLDNIESSVSSCKDIDYSPIVNLCKTSRYQINEAPITIPFNRKTFIYDLNKLLVDAEDENLKKTIIETAGKLPKSTESIPAFIVKYADSAPHKIAHFLLFPSLGTREHIEAVFWGDDQTASNFGHACMKCNQEKTNKSLAKFLKEKPEIEKYIYAYVDALTELQKNSKSKNKIDSKHICELKERLERESCNAITFKEETVEKKPDISAKKTWYFKVNKDTSFEIDWDPRDRYKNQLENKLYMCPSSYVDAYLRFVQKHPLANTKYFVSETAKNNIPKEIRPHIYKKPELEQINSVISAEFGKNFPQSKASARQVLIDYLIDETEITGRELYQKSVPELIALFKKHNLKDISHESRKSFNESYALYNRNKLSLKEELAITDKLIKFVQQYKVFDGNQETTDETFAKIMTNLSVLVNESKQDSRKFKDNLKKTKIYENNRNCLNQLIDPNVSVKAKKIKSEMLMRQILLESDDKTLEAVFKPLNNGVYLQALLSSKTNI